MWDVFPDYRRAGGSPFNVMMHLHRFGHRSVLLSAVGRDEPGEALYNIIQENNASTEGIQFNDHPTGIVGISLDDVNEPSFHIRENSAWDYISANAVAIDLAQTADALIFATLSQRTAHNFESFQQINRAVPASAPRFLDLNLRPPYTDKLVIFRSLQIADYAKFNQKEWETISSEYGVGSKRDFMEKCGLKGMVITKGPNGSSLYLDDGSHIPEGAAKISTEKGDFVGVGDAFWACFIHHVLKKTDWQQALKSANRYAGWVASRKGSIPDLEPGILTSVT